MIIDTGVLVAAADRSDACHKACAQILSSIEHRVVPEAVIVESDYLILERLGAHAELSFLDALDEGSFSIEPSLREDRLRARDIAHRYRDAEVGYVDAVIVAIAERLGDAVIASLDRRHFRMITPEHVDAFTLLPEGIPE